MKKFLVLFVSIVFLSSCDDGKLTVDSISFENKVVKKCDEKNILYNLNSNEALLLEIPSIEGQFINDTRVVSSIQIDATHQVRYRKFNGTIDLHNICDAFFPITPVVTEEWIATSGTIQITSKAVFSEPNAITGQVKIIAYNHQIDFLNIKFLKPSSVEQVYPGIYPFGIYQTIPTILPLDFQNDLNFDKCASNSKIYKSSSSRFESLVLNNISSDLIKNEVGTVTQAISAITNNLVYRSYETAIPTPIADYFCTSTTPISPVVKETWIGAPGSLTDAKGLVEVVTTNVIGGGFKHTITLKKVTFNKGENSFYYGNEIPYGVLYN